MSDCRKCMKFVWCAENEECGLFEPKPQTNADRIRSMTDEELAFYIVNHPMWTDEQACVDWLKEEAEGGE